MRIIFTGGGTGGHIYPGLAMAQLLQQRHPTAKILFIGTREGLEKELVPKAGFPLVEIAAAGLKRQLTSANIKVAAANMLGFAQALKEVGKFRPQAVVGTGGYVSVPVVLAAACLRRPILLHEQNAWPGLANRVLGRFASCVALTYEQAADHFTSARRVVVTGNPVRATIWQQSRRQGRINLNVSDESQLVLVVGGSRGARPITEAAIMAAPSLLADPGLTLLIVTGRADFVTIKKKVCRLGIQALAAGKMLLKPYIYNMEDALAAADIVVARAGATTLAEITARGLPAVLIPSPYVTANHQEHNARSLVDGGAAIMIKEGELSPQLLAAGINSLLSDPKRMAEMAMRARSLGRRGAAENLVREIVKLV